MGKSLLKGTVVGAIIVYVWMMVAWMLLPWHCQTLKTFDNQEKVGQMIAQNAPSDGIYVVPNYCADPEKSQEAMKKGPFAFVSVKRYGLDMESAFPYITAFVLQLIGAFFISVILLQLREGVGYWGRTCIVALIGLLGGVLGMMPSWIWWGFDLAHVMLGVFDLVIAWFLAGLALSALVKRH